MYRTLHLAKWDLHLTNMRMDFYEIVLNWTILEALNRVEIQAFQHCDCDFLGMSNERYVIRKSCMEFSLSGINMAMSILCKNNMGTCYG